MEIILKQDVLNLGVNGEIVKVKSGYARNYLIPKGLGILATESNRKVIEENNRQATYQENKLTTDAEAMASELKNISIKLLVKVGTTGKLFGSITNLQVSRSLKELGYNIDRKDITFTDEIKEIGDYTIIVKIYKNIEAEVKLEIIKDKKTEGTN